MEPNSLDKRRFAKTINFLKRFEPSGKTLLDLGVKNPLSHELEREGYNVINTQGEDLDVNPECLQNYPKVDAVTAFEILEHLVSPMHVLQNLPANHLVATVPLNLWFSKPYYNKNDIYDRHYHEFYDWQFEMLLEKAGWEIQYSEKWTAPINKIGFRPILRFFYPRFMAIYAIRK